MLKPEPAAAYYAAAEQIRKYTSLGKSTLNNSNFKQREMIDSFK
jgi:hypothetical protein